MELNDLRSGVTLLSFLAFIGIVVWAWSARRREDFDRAAQLALQDDDIDAAAQRSQGARQ
ncbi:MAG: cbb3-type cytochrome c oxidase subunit 3 [Burkholderiaceae bacterium]|nr:cbb3-type cytochrome c oxidase subunit 3 [Burkholderiaceae bacterium]